MPDDDVRTVTVFTRPMDEDGWSAEEVTLERPPGGDLTLRCHTSGRVIEMIIGEGGTEYRRTWTVRTEHVPRVLRAALRDLFTDTAALRTWLADTGIPTAAEEWQGHPIRPLDEDRLLIEAVRTVIGTEENDEGTTIADRFTTWLTEQHIGYEAGEQVTNAD
ncbi:MULTISPECIES: hypothetical protein [Protofrankia]|uniref:CYTH domain-containing protein n=1 Tax=Protofrankia coriariae TaxID=1562887 RepID=A0ABR5EZ95_9ACTN|nr:MULTISPECIES: hypothetical protein [Protofrankia]KLL09779.1 hypothetical protein FrCorBMG51_22545 [Protofrankia coriariae]ONH32207.1 hypothetical protein BL254_22070 [Protofrankia sp. BMG5.30]